MVSVVPMLVLMVLDVLLVVFFVFLYAASFRHLYKPYNMILVFGTDNAVTLKLKMDTRRDKYHINKLISVEKGFDAICEEIVKYDAVIINDVPPQIRNDLLKFCYRNSIRAYVVPKISDIIIRGGVNITSFDTPLLLTKGVPLTVPQRMMKRALDIALCLIALVLTAPVMAVIAIAIKLEDGGPVFYRQKRATIGGKEFDILKFRSMIVDAEKEGFSIPATGKDPRITRVGNVIRACRVDELPQLLNILKGDMSIVGPRPERLEHVRKYGEEVPEFMYRLKVKGGLTGYAQIYGKYNTTPYDKLRLDLMYIENYSILLDIKLILMTIRILFSKESTEGFEKQQQNEQRLQEMLTQIREETDTPSEQNV
jgi:exopolysaccharide biosynthesis polyprenyl glycosylphosphotransferase